jgi:hypothetical protein
MVASGIVASCTAAWDAHHEGERRALLERIGGLLRALSGGVMARIVVLGAGVCGLAAGPQAALDAPGLADRLDD